MLTVLKDFLCGSGYLVRGFSYLLTPGIRRYVIMPVLVNIFVLCIMFSVSEHFFMGFTQWVDHFLASWLHWLIYILWVLFAVIWFLFLIYCFNFLVTLLGAPFNGILAEAVVKHERGELVEVKTSFVTQALRSLKRSMQLLWYYLLRALALLIVLWIPLLQLISGVLYFTFNTWMLGLQYMDYPLDNASLDFKETLRTLRSERMLVFGFSVAIAVGICIPILNFFIMPAAVCGASLLWLERMSS